jgi:hypothetical protein
LYDSYICVRSLLRLAVRDHIPIDTIHLNFAVELTAFTFHGITLLLLLSVEFGFFVLFIEL